MKILMFVSVYFPSTIYGGPATVAKMQAQELVRRGHEVTIITTGVLSRKPFKQMENSTKNDNGVTIRYFKVSNKSSKFSYLYSKEMVSWLKKNVALFDVCHIHYGREINPIIVAKIALKNKLPYVIQTHGMLNSSSVSKKIIDGMFVKKQLQDARYCLVLQEYEKERINSIETKSKTLTFPNGVYVNEQKGWSINTLKESNILFLARLHPRKKVLNFVEMAKLLNDKNGSNKFSFRVVGPDGGELENAKSLARKLKVSNIKFIGEVENSKTLEEYLNASVYVLPSINEPFPMSVIESLKLGVPTIVTDSIHNKEILKSYDSVYISDGSPASLCNAVLDITTNPTLAEKLSSNGKKIVEEKLNINKLINKLVEIYS
ncbi:glycosyltransferase [Priestia aryabhattai]|uniref:glycosyltransferase n=1 Tax=Priestia aryabhattai TaxID=412384 RepID=UPI003D2CBFB5